MSQPAFKPEVPDRHVELLNFEMEVANVLQVEMYVLDEEVKVPIIMNWLGRESLQFIQTLTNVEKEACKAQQGCLMKNSGHSKMNQYYHYNVANCKEKRMNPHKSEWVDYVLKQPSVITKNMIDNSKNNLLMA